MAFGSESGNKLTYGITLASALAYFVTRQRDAVGLVTFDDRVLEFLPPKSRQPHLMQILRTLSAVTPGATTDAAKPLSDLAATLNKRSMIIFISDLLDDEERVISTLRNLRAMGNDVIVLHLMDNAELNFPFNESSEFIDMETSESYLANPAAIRGAYLENLNVFLNDCKKKCQRSDIDYCLLNTSEPLDSALSAYMARRAKGG